MIIRKGHFWGGGDKSYIIAGGAILLGLTSSIIDSFFSSNSQVLVALLQNLIKKIM